MFLFRSALLWFSIILVFFLALLPRFLMKAIKNQYFPTDIDILKEVQRYHPEIDIQRHPSLGGRAKASYRTSVADSSPSSRAPSRSHYPLQTLGNRGSMEAAARSVTDMSLGGVQSTHRGFDFASEEGGVHIRRMQSNLSERRMRTLKEEGEKPDRPRDGGGRHRSLSLFPSLRRSVRRRMRPQSPKPPKSPPEPSP